VADGEKGPGTYDWACARMVESRDGFPGPDAWLLTRRSISDPSDIAYYLLNALLNMPLLKLAQVAATRFTVEQCKGNTGTGEYEVRYWYSWYRHFTLSMMGHVRLACMGLKDRQEGGLQTLTWPNGPCQRCGACWK
jgi:hypothetical protein